MEYGHLILKLIPENTTANALLVTNGVLFLPIGLWSLAHSPYILSFPNTCFCTCLGMSPVVQLVSDFVFTPYILRQQAGGKVNPPPVTCVMLMMMCKMSSMFFSTAPIHLISLRRIYALLFPPTGGNNVFTFLSQNNNKLYFFLHELIAFYEHASNRTS